jgi:hypothetical protein
VNRGGRDPKGTLGCLHFRHQLERDSTSKATELQVPLAGLPSFLDPCILEHLVLSDTKLVMLQCAARQTTQHYELGPPCAMRTCLARMLSLLGE